MADFNKTKIQYTEHCSSCLAQRKLFGKRGSFNGDMVVDTPGFWEIKPGVKTCKNHSWGNIDTDK
jgi:hypothetical protein